MNNNLDPILREDLAHISEIFPHWEELSGKSVFVTGATGLVGSMLVRTLCAAPVEYLASLKKSLPSYRSMHRRIPC